MLSLAVMMGQTDVVRVLLEESSVDVNEASGEVDWTPLAAASRYGYFEAAKLLIDHKANVNTKDKVCQRDGCAHTHTRAHIS
jgi:ankyrin repeat protein